MLVSLLGLYRFVTAGVAVLVTEEVPFSAVRLRFEGWKIPLVENAEVDPRGEGMKLELMVEVVEDNTTGVVIEVKLLEKFVVNSNPLELCVDAAR